MSKVIKNYSSNDESDDEVYMFSTKCKSTDKRQPINIDSKEANMLWTVVQDYEYVRRENVQNFRHYTNIEKI